MKLWLAIICLLFSLKAVSGELQQAYEEGALLANNHANQSIDVLKGLDTSQFPGLDGNTPQQNYYGGVTQNSTSLEADSATAARNTDVGHAVHDSFNNRPFYKVNPESPSMQKLHQIADASEDIMHGQSTDKTTCTLKPETCQYVWQEKTCLASKGLGVLRCARHLRIDVSSYKTESYNVYMLLGFQSSDFSFELNLHDTDTCLPGKMPCYTVLKDSLPAPAIVLPPDCAMVKVSIVDEYGLVVVSKSATCTTPTVTLSFGNCVLCNIPWMHSISMTVEIFQTSDVWDDRCEHLKRKEEEGICRISDPLHCVEGAETRVISEMPITRTCWKEQATYDCAADKSINTCDSLINDGCEQSTSVCVKETAGRCAIWQQTWQCPMNQCTKNQLICGEDAFCLDGNCSSHDYAPSNEDDFKKAMSSLSAVSDASKDFDGKGNFIFKGEMLECSSMPLDVKNCCRDKGWGIDMNLFHCKDSEKKLGKARESNLVVATGKYCAKRKKWPGGSVCTDEHETFCVFQSKLARMVQEQGRRNQLGIGFGKGKHSNCTGLTPEQLSLIDFRAIDFTEFYDEIKNKQKNPDMEKTANGISQRVQDFYKQGDING